MLIPKFRSKSIVYLFVASAVSLLGWYTIFRFHDTVRIHNKVDLHNDVFLVPSVANYFPEKESLELYHETQSCATMYSCDHSSLSGVYSIYSIFYFPTPMPARHVPTLYPFNPSLSIGASYVSYSYGNYITR